MILRILHSSNPPRENRRLPRNQLFGGLIILLAFSAVFSSGPIALVRAATSSSWNTRVPCAPLVVRVTDITANQTGSASFSASQFTPGITTSVSGGNAKRWLTPGPTPSGWVSPGPGCSNSKGTSLFVEIDGVERDSISTEDSASTFDATNGGTSHSATSDSTFNIFDPAVVPNFSNSCTSPSDPTCYGRIHSEIDHDWKAASYCGTGTSCDPSALAGQTSYASTKIDVQGFIYWDPGHLSAGYHNYNGWEIHPLTAWRLHQSTPDFSISTAPSGVSFNAGTTGSFTTTITSQNGFTGTVSLSTSANPTTGLTVNCSPSSISGGSGSSTCTLNSSTVGSYTATVTGTSGNLVHSSSVSVTVTQPPSPDFTIKANPATLTMLQGSSGTSTINISSVNGYSGTLNLSASISPSGPTTNLNPTTITLTSNGAGSSTLNVTSNAAPQGSYSVNVTATSGSLSHSVIVAVSITGQPNFSISASPSSLTLGQTSSATITPVTVTASDDQTWFESSYLADSFSAQGLIWMFFEDTSKTCEHQSGCLLYTTSTTGSNWATPTITTNLSSSKITAGGSVTDSATLTLSFQAGGTATYNVFSTGDCTGTSTIVSTVTVTNGAVPNSASRTFNTPGNYSWSAVYSGDPNDNGATSSCEPLVVNSSTTTPPSYAIVVSYEGFVYRLYPNGTLSLIGQPVTSQLRAVSWKPDGSYALIIGDHAVLIKYDGTSLTTIPTGIATTVNFLSISWRPDGSYALVGGSGGILLKYDGTTVTQIPSSYAVSFRAISWNPSGTQALLVSYFGQVFQYQSTGQLTKLSSGASQSFDAVAWSPDGSYALIAGDGGGILKYNGTTFQALNTAGLYSSTLTVRFISFNPADNLALLVGDSGLVLTYNGTSLSALPTLTSNTLYSVSWTASTAYIVGGAGAMLTYSGGTLKTVPTGTFSGFRGIAWKP